MTQPNTTPSGVVLPFGVSPLLNTEQVAAYTGLAIPTLEGYRSRGGGPKFVKYGRKAVRYRLSAVDEWIESKTVERDAVEYLGE